MASPVPDRMLKRKLVQLARLEMDDLTAVLDELEPEPRRRVEEMLQEHCGTTVRPRNGSGAAAPLSAWLVARIEGAAAPITPAAQAALSEAAGWRSTLPSDPPRTAARRGIFERGFAALAGGGSKR